MNRETEKKFDLLKFNIVLHVDIVQKRILSCVYILSITIQNI